jgi:hypothetical protein
VRVHFVVRSVKNMKWKLVDEINDELCSEYELKELLKSGVQGKYSSRYREGTNSVLLAPDVAKAFPTEEAVNDALRLVIQLRKIPSGKKKAAL